MLVIRPNERRSVYTFMLFGAVSAVFLLLGGLPGICVGNLLIAAIVIHRNWSDARFGEKAEKKWKRERMGDL